MNADDTTLFCNVDNKQNKFTINNELDNVYRWLCSNKLSLSVSKIKYMCIHTPKRKVIFPDLKINNITIKIIGVMFRLKYIVPCYVLQTLYNSLIMPHFHYCLLAWGSTI